jgi:signal transduction histidine kinase
MGWTETLLTEHPGPLNEMQKRFLNIVYGSSQRLNRLIEEILTVSRIQRGTLRLVRERIDPRQLLARVVEAMQQVGERQGVRFQIEENWPPAQTTMGDPQQLEQVLSNLLGNAIKFSPDGGVVSIRSTSVHGAWRVEIRDNGMGIPADDQPRLFQRFVRGSNARTAQIQGTGLGLYVSKAIVEGHGGEIHLTSHEGAGTTVWFYVPATPAGAA